MSSFVASGPVAAASENPILAPIVLELYASRFALFHRNQIWLPNGVDNADLAPALWGAHFQDEGAHLGIVISVVAREGDWGVSVKSSSCGRNGGVCYWESVGGPITRQEPDWPGLGVAVRCAQQLATQYRAQ